MLPYTGYGKGNVGRVTTFKQDYLVFMKLIWGFCNHISCPISNAYFV